MGDNANIDDLSADELTDALNDEIANLGQKQDDETTDTDADADADADEDTDDTSDNGTDDDADASDDADADDEPATKSEKKIKKLLAQRNKERTEKAELETRVKELEKTNADKDFYKENPDAVGFKEDIDKMLIDRPNLTRQEAYILKASGDILADNKQANAGNRKITGTTPGNITSPKKPSEMTTKELDDAVLEGYKNGKISI